MQDLIVIFPNQWIGRGSTITWPLSSPDGTKLDFCSWGWMESKVYRRKIDTRDEPLEYIVDAITSMKKH
jgi:hypothetical protein